LGHASLAKNGRDQAQSCLILLEEGNGRKIAGGAPAARLVSRFPHFVLIAAASDLRRRAAGRSAALPLNQAAKAFCQDQRGGAHLYDLDFASRD
jgi:hypothetical protein